ncbi:MAG: hypothetical protein QME48_05200 [bacterium]|uniref:Lipoprotein n=2 Tax=Bacteria candidate phyla TaxID=1783234 RepID=A0A101I397_UNCT6|nr:MAG: hypothetical protein XD76_0674 [candidate division TA06 bacterium 32_111]KUK87860.1 MAG: hypothetical protein XE03_0379 [candidate division TA06 bacterium 34_109]MDI6700611.1 hypothetical protein [bacterium]HAF08012.1 hypothetical protein [candidate division WOR-3 bacterium]HCP16286.1 hypothetical protein [candidate division WOR-3 bacterium]
MKNFLLLSIFFLFTISCSIGPIPVYYTQPIVTILDDTLEVVFSVPDKDASGWNHYNPSNIGSDTVYLSPEVYEKTGIKSFIEKIEYRFLVDGNTIQKETYEFDIPIETFEKDTISLPELMIVIDEQLAYTIDTEDGFADNVGNGIIELLVYYTDLKGEGFSSVPIRRRFKLVKPLTY